jgi:hypothetical protein
MQRTAPLSVLANEIGVAMNQYLDSDVLKVTEGILIPVEEGHEAQVGIAIEPGYRNGSSSRSLLRGSPWLVLRTSQITRTRIRVGASAPSVWNPGRTEHQATVEGVLNLVERAVDRTASLG